MTNNEFKAGLRRVLRGVGFEKTGKVLSRRNAEVRSVFDFDKGLRPAP